MSMSKVMWESRQLASFWYMTSQIDLTGRPLLATALQSRKKWASREGNLTTCLTFCVKCLSSESFQPISFKVFWDFEDILTQFYPSHEFHETCHSVTFHFMKKGSQTMLWHHNTRVNSHQIWKQTRFRVCFHLWCELTSTMNVMEWQVSWNSCSNQ